MLQRADKDKGYIKAVFRNCSMLFFNRLRPDLLGFRCDGTIRQTHSNGDCRNDGASNRRHYDDYSGTGYAHNPGRVGYSGK
jgi:hypothetical protein